MVALRRNSGLRALLEQNRPIRLFGSGDGIGGLIAERNGFEGVWASGLAISTGYGVPDASIITMSEMLHATAIMVSRTRLPVVADCDSGFGDVNTVARAVTDYERIGAAAVCFEDKRFPKRNSFMNNAHQLQTAAEFAALLEAAVAARSGDELMVIARLESLIAGESLAQAIGRGLLYQEAGADIVLVHSRSTTPDEVLDFAREWHGAGGRVPLAAIPTTYPQATVRELHGAGYAVIVYANQGLRASIRAMDNAASSICAAGTSHLIEDELATVKDVFSLVNTEAIHERTRAFEAAVRRLGEA